MLEPAFHVAEAVLIGDQVDETLAAIGVELSDFFGGHGTGVLPDVLVAGVGECVFGVELKVIDFPFGESVDQREEGLIVGTLSRLMSSMTPRTGKSGNPLSQGTAANRETACEAAQGFADRKNSGGVMADKPANVRLNPNLIALRLRDGWIDVFFDGRSSMSPQNASVAAGQVTAIWSHRRRPWDQESTEMLPR